MREYVEYVLRKAKKPISLEKIFDKIEILDENITKLSNDQKAEIIEILERGCKDYDFYRTPNGNYTLFSKTSFVIGRFHGNRDGGGKIFVTRSYTDKDGKLLVKNEEIKVATENNKYAINDDIVLADCPNNGDAVIKEVIERKLSYVPGEVYREGTQYYLRPADKKRRNMTISLGTNAIEGAKVAVYLVEQTAPNYYIGEVVRTFGHKDDPDEDIYWEAFKAGINTEFSEESLEQLKHIPQEVRDVDKIGREDFTEEEIFTIDGIDTKDMDDAIGLKINSRGNFELNVSITDIATLIPEGSPLDIDAFRKCNSYYLGGKVFPMFPHDISNGIGSLNEGVDRLTISVVMEFNPQGKRVGYRIVPSVINSKKKMNYDKVNEILKTGVVDPKYKSFEKTLHNMNKLALTLRKNRILNGAVEFNRPEPKLKYDDDGDVAALGVRTQDVAENLIEEFMLAANECVDTELSRRGLPCVHRVHDSPNEDKIQELLILLDAVNLPYYKYDAEELATNKRAFQDLIKHISGHGSLSNFLMVRAISCMSRAKYSPNNIGHYGLSKENYCHFTSPVRRYADLTVQRILWDCVFNKNPKEVTKNVLKWKKKLPDICAQTSYYERVANDCENEVFRMQSAGYMEHEIGTEFEGTVVGVSNTGLTIELDDYLVEGFISTKDLKGEYTHSPDSYSLVSLEGQPNYYIGDKLKVQVNAASKSAHTINFGVVEKIMENKTRTIDRSAYAAGTLKKEFTKQYTKSKRARRRK